MAKDERKVLRPANDDGTESSVTMDPDKIRASLVPLVKLLARQAAREWYEQMASDNPQAEDVEHPELERP